MLQIEFQTEPVGLLEILADGSERVLGLNSTLRIDQDSWLVFVTTNGSRMIPESDEQVEILYAEQLAEESNTHHVIATVKSTGSFLIETLGRNDAIPHSIHLDGRSIGAVVTVKDWEHLRTVAKEIEAEHESFELLGVKQVERIGPLLGDDQFIRAVGATLSNEQLQLLETAYRAGYFDVPQQVTATEVATELGISQSTFSENIRRALGNLLFVLFGESAEE